MTSDYPKRPKFFAYRFCRVMAKVCLANEIGAEACWLLTVIAQTEDAKGYRDAVTFFNGQLMAFTGCKSDDALNRIRAKAVSAGWLHYKPGGKGRAGRYWVRMPEQHSDWDDAPSDEWQGKYDADPDGKGDYSAAKTRGQAREKPGESADQSEGQAREKPGESAEHSSLTLPLTQEKSAAAAGGECGGGEKTVKRKAESDGLFARFWAAYPRKTAKPKAAAAFAKLKVTEELLAAMLAAVAWQARTEQWVKDGGTFIPYPATWLNGRRWEDEGGAPKGTHHEPQRTGAVTPGGGHRIDAPEGKYARPAGDGLQTRRKQVPPEAGAAESRAEQGGDQVGPSAGAA